MIPKTTIGYAALALLAGCTTTRTPLPDQPLNRGKEQRDAAEFTPDAMLNVADRLRASGDHMSALRLYQQVRGRDPKNTAALVGEGESLLALGAAEAAEQRYRAALAIEAESGDALAGLARALARQNRAEEALPYFEAAIAKGKESPELFNHYGVALDLLGRHEAAQMRYGSGLDLAPGHAGLTNNLALSFALGGHYETAVRLLSGLVTDNPEMASAKHNLAMVYGLSGDLAAAEKLSALDFEGDELRNRLAYIRHIARLPMDLRPRAIILGLDAVAAEALAPKAEPQPAPAPQPQPRDLPDDDPVYGVQLGAYPDAAIAAAAWPKIRAAASELLDGYEPLYRPAGDLVRLLVPAEGWTAADALCRRLKDAGVDCLPRRLRAQAAGSKGE